MRHMVVCAFWILRSVGILHNTFIYAYTLRCHLSGRPPGPGRDAGPTQAGDAGRYGLYDISLFSLP